MRIFESETGASGYRDFVHTIARVGTSRSPRGIQTLDAGPMTWVIRDVTRSLPLGTGRSVSRKIAAAEAVQLIGGFDQPHLLLNASPNFRQFLEPDTGQFYGAYGARIGVQLNHVVRKLSSDRDTRQAVITLWSPTLDNEPGHRDHPCTVMLHLAIRDDELELTTTMRSQDVWLGTPFDVFMFTQLQQTVARVCDVRPGAYRHITLSTHIYESNLTDIDRLTEPITDEWQPHGIGRHGDNINVTRSRARGLISPMMYFSDLTDSESWYREQLKTII